MKPPSPPKPHISYRTSLLVALPLLVLATTGIVAWRSIASAKHEVSELAAAQFSEAARSAVAATRSELQRAVATLEELDNLAHERLVPLNEDGLARMLLAMIAAEPNYTWMSFSDNAGRFVGVRRDKGGYFANFSGPAGDGRVAMREFRLNRDGTRALHRSNDDHGYDPRTRPFYRAATMAPAGAAIWTEPYVFFEEGGTPGITCALAVRDNLGSVRGVFTVDFNLAGLSRVLAAVRLGRAGSLTLTTAAGELLAHPNAVLVDTSGRNLLRAANSLDPVIAATAAVALSTPRKTTATVIVDNAEWLVHRVAETLGTSLVLHLTATAPATDFLGGIEEHARENLIITLVALVVGVLLALLFASRLSRPLARLADDMRRVGAFELDAKARGGSLFREIDTMEHALEAMKGGLRSFGSFVPRDLVRRLLANRGELRVEGELRAMTILFSDIEGFTSLSEKTAPATLVAVLSRYLAVVTRVFGLHRGTVDKFLGDGVMAFWNAPELLEDHPVAAVRAAMQLQQELLRLQRDDPDAALPTRIGLATGEVVVGTVGTAERLNYTALGDTVNLAARLEALNKQWGTRILCNDAVMLAASAVIVFRPVDAARVRGKAEPLMVWEPLCERNGPDAGAAEALAALCADGLAALARGDKAAARGFYEAALTLAPTDPVAAAHLAAAVS